MFKEIQTFGAGVKLVEVVDKHKETEKRGQQHNLVVVPTTFVAGEQPLDKRWREEEEAQRGNGETTDNDRGPHVSRDQRSVLGHRFFVHVACECRCSWKREGRQRVHDNVDPEQLGHRQRQVDAKKRPQKRHKDRGHIDREMEDEKLARYGKRIIFYESPDSLSDKDRSEVEKDIWKYTIETDWISRCRGDDLKQEFYKVANKADDDGDQDTLEKLEALELLWEDIAKKCKGLS